MVPFQSEKGQNSSTKMVSFEERVKNLKQKWYHFRKGSKPSTKMVPFQKMVKTPQQKWYHFRQKRVKIPQQNVNISEKDRKSSTKMVPFQGQKSSTKKGTISVRKGSSFLDKKGTISEKGQNYSTKMEPFQKMVKHHQQKWYHFRQG